MSSCFDETRNRAVLLFVQGVNLEPQGLRRPRFSFFLFNFQTATSEDVYRRFNRQTFQPDFVGQAIQSPKGTGNVEPAAAIRQRRRVWGVYSRGGFSRQHTKLNFFAKDSHDSLKILKVISISLFDPHLL